MVDRKVYRKRSARRLRRKRRDAAAFTGRHYMQEGILPPGAVAVP